MSKNELITKINEARHHYYNGQSIMSDEEFDELIQQLTELDPNNKAITDIGSNPTSEWQKDKHLTELGSLNKVNSAEEISKWILENLKNQTTILSEKLDGLSIGCQYDNGILTKALLRGNGVEGENILTNVLKMIGVVKTIPNFSGTIRGEIVLTKSNHKQYFLEYSNPRNAASGLCRRFDGEGSEHLTLMFYQVISSDKTLFSKEQDQFSFLKKNGFITPNYFVCNIPERVAEIYEEYQKSKRDSLDYEIDGLVASCDDINFGLSLGSTNMRPKSKMAIKFANQFIKTTVKNITWACGNSGRITPICWFEPVNLLGSTIEKASIYNVDYVNTLAVDVGAEILVCKANEIIPRVEKVIKSTNTVAKPPSHCPECQTELLEKGEYLQCPNTANCSAQRLGRCLNWLKELDVKEWGEKLLVKILETGKVNSVADLYLLTASDLETLDRMGKKSAANAIKELHLVKEVPLDILIGGLSIPMIGGSTIRAIMAAGYDTLNKLQKMSVYDLESVDGIGSIKAKSLYDGLIANQGLISQLLSNGVKIRMNNNNQASGGKLSGVSFQFTGTMLHKRSELEKMATDLGAEIKSVGRGLTYLVVADPNSGSSKLTKATSLGVKLLSEEDFLEIVGQ